MRELMKPATFRRALPGGLSITALCIPFLLAMGPPGGLRVMRIAFMAPISILLVQVGVAWTPLAGGQQMMRLDLTRTDYARIVLIAIGMAVLARLGVDPLLSLVMPDYFPRSFRALVLSLPWVALFQPVVFVAGCYAFAARLTRHPIAALACVVLAHQAVLFMQLDESMPARFSVPILAVAGAYGLLLGWSYRTYGLTGPVAIALASQLRHAFRLV